MTMDIPYGVIVDLVRYGYVSFPYNRSNYEIDLDVTDDGMILNIETNNTDEFINDYIQWLLSQYVELYIHLVECEGIRKVPFNK